MSISLSCINGSVRIYKALIRAYPARFRQAYGTEMSEVFRDLATEALRKRAALGLVMVWCRVLQDFFWTVPQEYASELQRRFQMKTAAFGVLSLGLAAIVYGVMLAVVGITLFGIFWLTESPMFTAGNNSFMELILVYAPAFLTGMILSRVKPFFMPMLTAAMGTMAYWACIALLYAGPPWWARVMLVTTVGAITVLGCIVSTMFQRRRLSKPLAV